MLSFVNAKINLGLQVVRKLPSGYHQLETIFYPVGLYNGTTICNHPFCDILEIISNDIYNLQVDNWNENLPADENIVSKAYIIFKTLCADRGIHVNPVSIYLHKQLPSQAGMGGGSADASFTLRILNEMHNSPLDESLIFQAALKLGTDCPFFLYNKPALAKGVGEIMTPLEEKLKGYWCAIAKPEVDMPTAKAFSLITPSGKEDILQKIYNQDISTWRNNLTNDFEKAFLQLYPSLITIKDSFYDSGALYSSLTGSGAAFYGIFKDEASAIKSLERQNAPYKAIALL